MSSISLPFEKQIRRLIIAESVDDSSTVSAFMSSADPLSVAVFSENGTAVEEGVPFYFAYKNAAGVFRRSDLIHPKRILTTDSTAPVSKVGKSQAFTVGAVTANKVYNLQLKINYAGSEVNFTTIHASAKASSTDTATTVVARLAQQIATNLSDDIKTSTNIPGTTTIAGQVIKNNKYFTITASAGVLTITEKNWILDGFKLGLKEFDQLSWNATLGGSFFEQDDEVTMVETPGVAPKNQGYEVAAAEYYLQLHSQSFFGKDITSSIREELVADINEEYHIFDMSYYDESVYDPQKSEKMLTIASDDDTVIEDIIEAVQTAMGTLPEGD